MATAKEKAAKAKAKAEAKAAKVEAETATSKVKAPKEKPTFVCEKCGSVSEEKGCVCCNRH